MLILLIAQTEIQNLGEQQKKLTNDSNSKVYGVNLVIPQSNNYDITFNWNGEEYELVLDASFWIQPYPVESFINKLSQHYANDVIITESQKIGFQPVKSKQHTVCYIRGSILHKKKKILCLRYRRELIEFLAESCKTRCEILSL